MDLARLETMLFYVALGVYFISMVLFILFFVNKKDKLGSYGRNFVLIGIIIHTLALVARTINAGRLPLSNQYEFATTFAWGIALCYLIFEKKFSFKAMGTFVTPILFLIIGYAAMRDKSVRPLMPALQSNWLAIHVGLAIISYGSFAVAAGISGMYIMRDKFGQDSFFQKHIPDPEKLDDLSYRAIAAGFLFLSVVIITGAIWAEAAWGSYWAWDPKETWALITWIIYAIYLHLRISKGWRGKKTAWFAIIGFICVIFTYVGVNTLLPSLHSYV
ncbi:MAG: c-type cytochrome biogenesis protein CcsB [Christensenellaceae bacterium]|nr:c-type cytochrome biogenesis protein CcsB [Christensenellaceae bacterium]